MIKIALTMLLFLPFGNVFAQYPNVLIGNQFNPNEPSIVINPLDPQKMVAGANLDNFYFSNDGGYIWLGGNLTCNYGVWGDPCIVVDTLGNFYFLHLSTPPYPGNWIDRIVCQKSTDQGQSWSNGSYMGLNGTKAQDKAWAVVDRSNNHIYTTWTQFDQYGTDNPSDSSIIRFSKSIDGGASWSTPVRINRRAGDCLDEENTVEGAVPAIGTEGEIYVSWAGPLGLLFTRSLDEGDTWPVTNIFVSDIPGGWDYSIPGISRANGLPVTCCDLSQGPYRGNIYINWSDQRNGPTDTDIWFVKSSDGGNTWCPPKRVNNDAPGYQQFFTWMTVDQVTGFIWFVFYDRREHSNTMTDVYMAVSRDGGETFQNFRVSESPFSPDPALFFGDYTNISAVNNIVRPIWTRLNNDSLSIFTAIVDSMFTGIAKDPQTILPLSLEQNYPNPAYHVTAIPFSVKTRTQVTLTLFDLTQREIAIIIDHKNYQPGKYIEYYDVTAHRLNPGFYYYCLTTGNHSLNKKMIIK
ncbi:MAG: T9SS type A sorting domain-containing protein [Bacteroidetes bacterium]|nr:T9SS type A sorting domain-containing protein [Bacteroidota bacterium]